MNRPVNHINGSRPIQSNNFYHPYNNNNMPRPMMNNNNNFMPVPPHMLNPYEKEEILQNHPVYPQRAVSKNENNKVYIHQANTNYSAEPYECNNYSESNIYEQGYPQTNDIKGKVMYNQVQQRNNYNNNNNTTFSSTVRSNGQNNSGGRSSSNANLLPPPAVKYYTQNKAKKPIPKNQPPISNYFQATKQGNAFKNNNYSHSSAQSVVSNLNSNSNFNSDVDNDEFNKRGKNSWKSVDICVWTGTAERVIKWHKLFNEHTLYEVIASVIGLKDEGIRTQKIMLLRDPKGPVLQVIYYSTDYININEFSVGKMLRCVGRMVASNRMHAFSIRDARDEEINNLQRMCYISNHAVTRITEINNNLN